MFKILLQIKRWPGYLQRKKMPLTKVMKRSYNVVAPFYDRLLRLIFGDDVLQSQIYLVNAIKPDSSVLIIGGGTGYILEEISRKHPNGLAVTYVDISKKMIDLSKKRNAGDNEIFFVNQSISDVAFTAQFDVVVTPFFLDNFSNSTAEVVFAKINAALASGGLWLFADFQLSEMNNLWQKFLLKYMYFFFRFLCNIEASHLPDTAFLFEKYQYQLISTQTFYKNFICSSIYVKPSV